MRTQLKRNVDVVFEFRKTLTPETDRGCALMAAAYLDSQIEELLRKLFVDKPEVADELLGLSKPLGSFSARIDLAFLLGKIGEKEMRDLHLIRKIRNDFGHNPSPITFEHPPIASRCRELLHTLHKQAARPRAHFTSAVFAMLARIHAVTDETLQPSITADNPLPEATKQALRDSAKSSIIKIFGESAAKELDEF
jgi:DNA-binding MltR family transcriptional regulator